MNDMTQPVVRRSVAEIEALFTLPFADLLVSGANRSPRAL